MCSFELEQPSDLMKDFIKLDNGYMRIHCCRVSTLYILKFPIIQKSKVGLGVPLRVGGGILCSSQVMYLGEEEQSAPKMI